MYRQLSLDYFQKTEKHSQPSSAVIKSVAFLSFIRLLFTADICDDVLRKKSNSESKNMCVISVCAEL